MYQELIMKDNTESNKKSDEIKSNIWVCGRVSQDGMNAQSSIIEEKMPFVPF